MRDLLYMHMCVYTAYHPRYDSQATPKVNQYNRYTERILDSPLCFALACASVKRKIQLQCKPTLFYTEINRSRIFDGIKIVEWII